MRIDDRPLLSSPRGFLSLLLAPTLAGMLIAGCTGGAPASAAALRTGFDSANVAFHQALRSNDTTSFLDYVADDARMMPPNEAPVIGKDGVRTWMAGFLGQYRTSSLELSEEEVYMGDGWATLVGSYEWGLTPVAGGAPVVDRGHFIQVWHHTAEGQWLFSREIWNSSVPPSAPVAP